jgi:hypothetical protein
VDPLMRDSLPAKNARNKPKLRKEAGFADKGLDLRKFGSESLDETFNVNQIGEQIGALYSILHQDRA